MGVGKWQMATLRPETTIGWSAPSLSVSDVVAVLDLIDAADASDVLSRAPGLAEPYREYGDVQWSVRQVSDYVLAHRSGLSRRIPRLYPFTAALGPARFLFGQIVGDANRFGATVGLMSSKPLPTRLGRPQGVLTTRSRGVGR